MTANLTSSNHLILEELGINPNKLKTDFPVLEIRLRYRLVFNWLTDYKSPENGDNLDKVKGYLEAFEALCEIEAWDKASKILSVHLNISTQEKLGNQLEIWGHYKELIQLYDKLYGKISKSMDAICLKTQGSAYRYIGNWTAAYKCCNEALDLFMQNNEVENGAWVLHELGLMKSDQGKDTEALSYYIKALRLFKNKKLKNLIGIASCFNNIARLNANCGNYVKAIKYYQKSLNIYRNNPQKNTQQYAWLLHNLGRALINQGSFQEGEKYTKEGLALFLENETGKAWSYFNFGILMLSIGKNLDASNFANQALKIFREKENQMGIVFSLQILGQATFRNKDYEQSHEFYREMLEILQIVKNWTSIPFALEGFARLAAALNQPERAAFLFGSARFIREDTQSFLPPADIPEYEDSVAITRTQIDSVTFNSAYNSGWEMAKTSVEQVIDYTLVVATCN